MIAIPMASMGFLAGDPSCAVLSTVGTMTPSSREIYRPGREGRIYSYHEILLLIWRPAGEGVKLVSKFVPVRSPYQVFWPRTLWRQACEYFTSFCSLAFIITLAPHLEASS